MEETLLILKPDAVRRKITGKIITRVEESGLIIQDMKMVHLTKRETGKFYGEHRGEEFFKRLVDYMSSGRIVVLKLRGEKAIKEIRNLIGVRDPQKAKKGTIRGDYGLEMPKNTVHASDSVDSAEKELSFFFED